MAMMMKRQYYNDDDGESLSNRGVQQNYKYRTILKKNLRNEGMYNKKSNSDNIQYQIDNNKIGG